MAKRRRKKRFSKKKVEIDKFKRYQSGLTVKQIYPAKNDGLCDCGCETPLSGRQRRWASEKCKKEALNRFWIIKGDIRVIREELKKRDKGVCAECSEKAESWDADHIVEVRHGGGACELDNFQTLCSDCHKAKTKENYQILEENE